MKLPTLYSRRGDGRTQEWTIEYNATGYRTISGLTDGRKVVSKWTVCSSKNVNRTNETSQEEQAKREAEAKWQHKIDIGYMLLQQKVDDHSVFKPMLAKNYSDHCKSVWPSKNKIFSDPKLNGLRCIAKADGLWTRNGKKITTCQHIESALAPLFESDPDIIVDGELYNHELRHELNTTLSLVRKTKITPIVVEAATQIQYHVYDGINVDGLGADALFSERKPRITDKIQALKSEYIKVVESRLVTSQEELDAHYTTLLAGDWEGQMVRIDGPYQNYRTSLLLKRKEFQDEEYEIVDIEEGSGNWTGTAKTVVLRHPDGRTFRSNIKGNYTYLQSVLKDKDKIVGKTATVSFFEKTMYDIPQFPFVVAIDRESVE